jgi:hypothetical protein
MVSWKFQPWSQYPTHASHMHERGSAHPPQIWYKKKENFPKSLRLELRTKQEVQQLFKGL